MKFKNRRDFISFKSFTVFCGKFDCMHCRNFTMIFKAIQGSLVK